MLFQCPFARLVWALSPVPTPPGGEWTNSIYTNIWWALNFHQEIPLLAHNTNLVPWIMWRLWKSRNDVIFKGKESEAVSVVTFAGLDAEEWAKGKENKAPQANHKTGQQDQPRWQPPPQNWMKCNIDGAWPRTGPKCGMGWVLRNHLGEVVWLGARALPRTRSVIEVEAEAFRWAVITMSRFRYNNVIFESDSQELIRLMLGEESRPQIDPTTQDIRKLLLCFNGVKCVFAKREGNEVADRIAKESLSFTSYDPKLYSIVPEWLKLPVEADKCT